MLKQEEAIETRVVTASSSNSIHWSFSETELLTIRHTVYVQIDCTFLNPLLKQITFGLLQLNFLKLSSIFKTKHKMKKKINSFFK